MAAVTRQVAFDTTSLISLFWILFYVVVFYWFYSTVKKMEHTLKEILQELKKKST